MEIKSIRWEKGLNTTISSCFVDGQSYCYILEDVDRGLKDSMNLTEIAEKKIPERTAIPLGRYEVIINRSNRFKRELMLFKNVKGFAGIRVHSGNFHTHTEGCLLPGQKYGVENGDYMVGNSRVAANALQAMVAKALDAGEKVFWTIEENYNDTNHAERSGLRVA